MDFTNLPDEELALYVRNQDNALFSEIIKRYERSILRYCSILLNNTLQAQELTQEIFIEAYENLYEFSQKEKFSSWLYRIAHKNCISFLAKRKQYVPLGVYATLEEELLGFDDMTDEYVDKKLFVHIKRYAQVLPEYERDPLVLHFFEKQSYEEISDILQLPVHIVMMRISKAQHMIKKHYEKA